jgi:hypothetical protein
VVKATGSKYIGEKYGGNSEEEMLLELRKNGPFVTDFWAE